MTVVVSGIALACSPVSAAMAAMITLTDVAPYNFDMVKVLSVTIPAAVIGIVLTALVMMRMGQGPRRRSRVPGPARRRPARRRRAGDGRRSSSTYTKPGRNAAFIFLAGVVAIVDLRPVPRPPPADRGRRTADRADRRHADHPDGDVHGRRADPAGLPSRT